MKKILTSEETNNIKNESNNVIFNNTMWHKNMDIEKELDSGIVTLEIWAYITGHI